VNNYSDEELAEKIGTVLRSAARFDTVHVLSSDTDTASSPQERARLADVLLSYLRMRDEYIIGEALNILAEEVHVNAVQHGWWGDLSDYTPGERNRLAPVNRNFGEVLALIHSEVSKALEEYRRGNDPAEELSEHPSGARCAGNIHEDEERNHLKPVGIPSEFADIIIRVLDACAAYRINIASAVRTKMCYNETRPFKHGNKRS
jgi:hypothetical protein